MRRFDGKAINNLKELLKVTLQLSQRQNIDDSIAKRFISPLAGERIQSSSVEATQRTLSATYYTLIQP